MTIPSTPPPALAGLTRDQLRQASTLDLHRAHAQVNTLIAHATTGGEVTTGLPVALRNVLHELIARRLEQDIPHADLLAVHGETIHRCPTDRHPHCPGHPATLVGIEVLTTAGDSVPLGLTHPVQYWLERLTPHTPTPSYLFDIPHRLVIADTATVA